MQIFDRVRALLSRHPPLATDKAGHPIDIELRTGTVVLLLETAYSGAEYAVPERRTILRGIEREFGMSKAAAESLMEQASRSHPSPGEVTDISTRIADRFDRDQRRRIVALLWKVVYADGHVDATQVEFANHVGELTGLSDEEVRDARASAFTWFSDTPSRGTDAT